MTIHLPAIRVGLDPGTANTLVYVKGRGVAVNQPSLVTIRTSTGHIEAVGDEAEAGLGRTPRKFQTARPIRSGAIADLTLFSGMLRRFLERARVAGRLRRLTVAIAVPSGTSEAARLAAEECVRRAGAAEVLSVEQVLAAAHGAGLAMDERRGQMAVDIGAGVTEVALLSMGSAVCVRATRVAGDDLDEAIAAHARETHGLIIGERTAERLKMQIGSAVPLRDELTLRVKGRCATRGVPAEATIGSGDVREAMANALDRIAKAIREALDEGPPEFAAGLAESGIVLTGGSALLRNLDRFIGAACGLPVRVAPDPLACVIRGLADRLRRS